PSRTAGSRSTSSCLESSRRNASEERMYKARRTLCFRRARAEAARMVQAFLVRASSIFTCHRVPEVKMARKNETTRSRANAPRLNGNRRLAQVWRLPRLRASFRPPWSSCSERSSSQLSLGQITFAHCLRDGWDQAVTTGNVLTGVCSFGTSLPPAVLVMVVDSSLLVETIRE